MEHILLVKDVMISSISVNWSSNFFHGAYTTFYCKKITFGVRESLLPNFEYVYLYMGTAGKTSSCTGPSHPLESYLFSYVEVITFLRDWLYLS